MKMKISTNQNSLIQEKLSIVPSTQNQPKLQQFEINVIGNMTDIDFYVPDLKVDPTGMAFRLAYYAAKFRSKNNKDLCVHVGSMLCSVVPEFRNSVEAALNEICVRPCFISLPSQANETKVVEISNVPELGWPSILVVFGYCIFLLFKSNALYSTATTTTRETAFSVGPKPILNDYITSCISHLQENVRWDPNNKLDIPFDETQAKSVTTMLGTPNVRATVSTFLMNNINHPDSQIRNVCSYLCNTLC